MNPNPMSDHPSVTPKKRKKKRGKYGNPCHKCRGYSAITFGSALNTNMTADETARRVPTPITDAAPKAYKYRNLSTGLIYEDPFGRDEWETLVFVELATCQQLEQENAALRAELVDAQKTIHEALTYFHDSGGRSMVAGDTIPQMFNALTDEMDDAKTERDEARKEAATLRELADGLAGHLQTCIDLDGTCKNATEEELADAIENGPPQVQELAKLMVGSRAILARYRAACPGEGQSTASPESA
jgi:hypothetical protein